MKKTTYDTPLSARLHEIATRNHWNDADMGRIADVSRSSVNGWHKRGTIGKESAAKIAAAANVSLSWLLTGKEEETAGALSEDEQALVDVYRALPPIEQRNMLAAFQMRLETLRDYYANNVDPVTRQK
ncbi:regulator [Salmonella enterica subsp. enterica serovar Namur str. 05-2929]|uniref:helix-turn-helix domain-containing protein n=2 Tax=Enterobacteriaceae TaxID=543 RepID=UPI000430C8B0|nr:helix-turn-helix domain-containing protein [Salmonella enterica]EIP0099791.1 helix-turn-helix domain-containing protein [Salmonella enterica subsp. enterica serovar Wangata]EXX82082.1 regulator [Salmonella enterica subsp. enterica serovar Namur str. 05-2929]HCM1942169.1 helix-turn-helix domain-containing protein [Salmonella enterica subsp. salamae serovar 30:g,m,s:e,n,x]EHQ0666450.1 helix-turn-helix domain-containing protein [Salmonella enterica subsp. enterica serovar Oranienburg]EKE280545